MYCPTTSMSPTWLYPCRIHFFGMGRRLTLYRRRASHPTVPAVLGLVFLSIAAGLLFGGAELFAGNAGAAGRRLGISGFAVGLLLAGAEPEELVTALIAAVRDRPGIAAGDALGANVTMLTLVLGLAALARPTPMRGRVRTYALTAAAVGGLAGLVVRDGTAGRA